MRGVDFGGGDAKGGNGLSRFTAAIPETVVKFFESMKALGIDVDGIQKLIKMKPVAEPGGSERTEKPREGKP